MVEAAAGILLLGEDQTMRLAQAALRQRGLAVQCIAGEAAGEARREAPPAVAVIGSSVAHPATAARRLRDSHPGIHVVFVAAKEAHETMRRTLLYAAPANTPWQLVACEADAVVAAAVSALDVARRTRQVRTTLDRVNLRLSAPAGADARQYRRLVVSDQYLASVLKHVQDAIISLDHHGTVLSWNDGATQVFGLAAREVTGASIDRIAAWSGSVQPFIAAALREGYARSELTCTVAGREVIVDATFSAIEQGDAEALAVAAILRDITERKRTEATLAANEARFRALADNIPQLAWMTDADGAIFWYNQRWFDYTGTTLDAMKGWGWQAVHHPEHLERVTAKFRAHLASGEAWEDTFPLRSRSGEWRWFLSRAFPIRDAAGRVTNWFGTNTDITEERVAREALVEADRRKNEFISVLSHELRNPLAPIRNSIFVLESPRTDEEMARKAREVIRRQTDHLTRLIGDLLDVTRVTRGKIALVRAVTDLSSVVRGTVEDYRGLAEAARIEMRLALPPEPIMASIDAVRIGQVLGNLLQNALKFSVPGGWIAVEAHCRDGVASILVRDSGVGIDPALLRSLFEPFVQGARSLDRSQGGLGLGLALARGIMRMHGGDLRADSEGADRGATFTVTLPAEAQAPAPRAIPGAGRAAAGPAPVARVLIVDDNRDAADSLAQLVELFGHRADVVYDGPSAVERARTDRPDLILCDIGLPGMDGYEVARRIRAQGRPVKLVAVSGYAQAEDVARAREAGFDAHMAKPPAPELIRELLMEGIAESS